MIRQTSLETYRQIRDEGLLSRMRFRVYSHLFHHGPMTARELDATMAAPGETRTSYHKRLSELERAGVVCTLGTRTCQVTEREALLWDVTNALPVELTPRAPRPTDAEFRNAGAELRRIYFLCLQNDMPFSPTLVKVWRWMQDR